MSEEGTFLNMDLDEDLDLEVIPADTEVELLVKDANPHESQAGNKSICLIIDTPEFPNADDIRVYLSIPSEDDDEKSSKKKRKRWKLFYQAFSIDYSQGVDLADIKGALGSGIVGEDEGEDGVIRNTIKKFVGGA